MTDFLEPFLGPLEVQALKEEQDIFAPIEDDGWNTDEKCPWCKRDIDELYRLIPGDGGDYFFNCPHCDQRIAGSEWRQYVLQKPRP